MPPPLHRILTLGRRAWCDLVRAQGALLKAQWRFLQEPIGALAIRDASGTLSASGDAERARQLAVAVQRAAAHGVFRPYCLVQTLALRELLLAERIEGASIRIGVRRDRGAFQAHAWIRWGDQILGDRPEHVATFTEVDDLRVMGNR